MSPAFELSEWQVRMVLPHRLPVLQLDRAECPAGLGALQAVKAVGSGDPMMRRGHAGPAHLAPGAVIGALAQCCGLPLRLRWLAQQGVDLVAFARGDNGAVGGHDFRRDVPSLADRESCGLFQSGCRLLLLLLLLLLLDGWWPGRSLVRNDGGRTREHQTDQWGAEESERCHGDCGPGQPTPV